MKHVLFIVIMSLSLSSFAETKREHKAHKHGAAKMAIAFDNLQGKITLELASEGIYGFEYSPKTASDKKAQQDGLLKIEKNISDIISFSPELKCAITKEKLEVDQHAGGKHSDIDASFKVVCEKDLLGSTLTFNIQKHFPKLKDVDVQLLINDFQKSVEANNNGFKVELKK